MGYDQGVIYLSNIQRMRYGDKKWKLSIQWMFIKLFINNLMYTICCYEYVCELYVKR